MANYVPLTEEEFAKAQKAGYTPERIIANEKIRKSQSTGGVPDFNSGGPSLNTSSMDIAGGTVPQSKTDTLQQLGDGLQAVFPNKNIGEMIGTPIARALAPADQKKYISPSTATFGGVVGDVTGDAINVGSLLAAPETFGASLGARSLFSGSIGGGLSLANSLSKGKSLKDPETWKDAGGTAIVSGLLPALAAPFSEVNSLAKNMTIDPQLQTVLKDATPEEVLAYKGAAESHAANVRNNTPIGLADSKITKSADILTKKIDEAGAAIGEAKKVSGKLPIGINPTTGNNLADEVLSNYNKTIEDRFGHTVETPVDNTSIKIDGKKVTSASFKPDPKAVPELVPMKGSLREISGPDSKRLLDIHSQLTKFAHNPTVSTASDIVHNIDDIVDWGKLNNFGSEKAPVDSALASLRGDLNHNVIRPSAPSLASANDAFSTLARLREDFSGQVGNDLQRGELPLARVFSGDKNNNVVSVFDRMKSVTGIDLVKEAGLAKWATDNFGSETAKSLFSQRMSEGGGALMQVKRSAVRFLKKAISTGSSPDVTKYALSLSGQPSANVIKNFIEGPKYQTMLDQLVSDPKARNLINTYLTHKAADAPYVGRRLLRGGSNAVQNVFRGLTQ